MSRAQTTTPYPVKGGCQSITTSGTTARTSAGVGAQTRFVAIFATEAAHYAFGDSAVTATTADTYIGQGGEHFVRILPGQYVAAIQSTAGGTVKVSEFAG